MLRILIVPVSLTGETKLQINPLKKIDMDFTMELQYYLEKSNGIPTRDADQTKDDQPVAYDKCACYF